jgi:hypothetical protein
MSHRAAQGMLNKMTRSALAWDEEFKLTDKEKLLRDYLNHH